MNDGPSTSKRVRYEDPEFEKIVTQWFEEAGGYVSDIDDCQSDEYEESQHDSDSEMSAPEAEDVPADNEETEHQEKIEQENNEYLDIAEGELEAEVEDRIVSKSKKSYFGTNRFKWCSAPPQSRTRTRQHNILVQLPGLRPSANLGTEANPKSVWKLIFSEEMLNIVLQWTNVKLSSVRINYKDPNKSDLQNIDLTELEAFLGLLFYTAVFNSNHEHVKRLFATDGTGRDIFRCVMNQKRFLVLLSCLRFDNPEDRMMRRLHNPSAPISELFELLISNSQKVFTPGPTTCIDEMVVPFRGRCKFKVYMPNKPAKYGIKIMCLTDSRNHYLFNAYVYTGKNSDGKGLTGDERKLAIPTQAVIRLTKPIENSNRNVTADNWFSSIQLVDELRSRGLTYVGTLKKNKREIPPEFLPKKSRAVGSSLHGFTADKTLVSFVPKKNRGVILVSSMHHTASIDETTNKPEVISFYNMTKGGVDALDEKCAKHTTSRRTRRWPMAIFHRLLDISGINSHVLYQSYKNNPQLEKADFIKELADELVRPHLERRLHNTRISREVRLCIRRVLGSNIEIDSPEPPAKLEKRKTCFTCPPRLKRKTFYVCCMCQRPSCIECARMLCADCHQKM